MYALVDCNSFFCSVEKVFHPGLNGKPVCVLSNNDGCIVALTPEAKALGLRRGDPIFKVSDIITKGKVAVFSSNMVLYAAMSRRITSILRKSVSYVENYSIDESFCCLDGYECYCNIEDYMRRVADKIKLWTDIPVSIGIAPTKTLAKIGSKFAKQYKGYRSVCVIDSEEKRRKALSLVELKDVWGVGRNTLRLLCYHGVDTPLKFADKKESWVRSHLKLPGVQTWKELNGIPCIDTSEVQQKQTICTSRSFGKMVDGLPDLKEAVSTFAADCANKLRGQNSIAGTVTVFILSNRFREDQEQYHTAGTRTLLVKTSDTLEITNVALEVLKEIYRPGIWYKKAGVVVGGIAPASAIKLDLFDAIRNRPARNKLMDAIDGINHHYGVKSVRLAAEGDGSRPWNIRCEHRSGDYLTDIKGLLTIRI